MLSAPLLLKGNIVTHSLSCCELALMVSWDSGSDESSWATSNTTDSSLINWQPCTVPRCLVWKACFCISPCAPGFSGRCAMSFSGARLSCEHSGCSPWRRIIKRRRDPGKPVSVSLSVPKTNTACKGDILLSLSLAMNTFALAVLEKNAIASLPMQCCRSEDWVTP